MAFNFGGMMQGLGQGLMNSSVLMNEQAKRDWEQQQLMLKLDREEHMERLKMKATSEENKLNRTHAETIQKQGFTHDENLTDMQMKQQKEIADRDLQINMQRLKGEQAERSAAASTRAEEMKMRREAYAAAAPEAQRKERIATAESLKELGIPEKAIGVFIATGQMPDLNNAGIKVDGSDLVAARKNASEEWDKLPDDEKRVARKELGVKTNAEASKLYQASYVAEIFSIPSNGSPTNTTEKQVPFSKKDLPSLVERAINKDPAAIVQFKSLYTSNPNDPDIIEANRQITGSLQKKPQGNASALKEKSSGVLTGPTNTTKEQAQENIKKSVMLQKLDKYSQSNYGKNFNQLTDSEKLLIQRLVD